MAVSILSVAADAAGAVNPADLSIAHLVSQADPDAGDVVIGLLP